MLPEFTDRLANLAHFFIIELVTPGLTESIHTFKVVSVGPKFIDAVRTCPFDLKYAHPRSLRHAQVAWSPAVDGQRPLDIGIYLMRQRA